MRLRFSWSSCSTFRATRYSLRIDTRIPRRTDGRIHAFKSGILVYSAFLRRIRTTGNGSGFRRRWLVAIALHESLIELATAALFSGSSLQNALFEQLLDLLNWLTTRHRQSRFLIQHFGHGFPFLLYAGFCVLEAWFVWTELPETKNRSLEDISAWWESSG